MKYEVELSADIWLGYIFFHLENGIFSLKTMISTDFSVLIDSSPNLLQMSLLGFILGFKVDLTWLSAVMLKVYRVLERLISQISIKLLKK